MITDQPLSQWPDDELGAIIGETITDLALPAASIEPPTYHPARHRFRLVSAAATIALAVGLTVGVVVAVLTLTPAGPALARWLGIGATVVEVDPQVDLSAPVSASVPGPTSETAPTSDATPSSVTDVDNPLPQLGQPEVSNHPTLGVTYRWPEVDGTQVDGVQVELSIRPVDGPLAIKTVAAEEAVELITITGASLPAIWIGEPHLLGFEAAEVFGLPSPSLAGPVLIWVDDTDRQFRLTGVEDRDQAIELARFLID